MKKRMIVTSLMLAVSLFGLSACGKSKTEDSILMQLETANTTDALMENNERAAFTTSCYLADGNVDSSYAYKDQERFVLEDAYGIVVDENKDVYGFDNEMQAAYRYLYIENAYDELSDADFDAYILAGYAYSENEKLVSTEERDGVLVIHTEYNKVEDYEETIIYCGYDMADVENVMMEYEADATTKELLKMVCKIKTKEGAEPVLFETVREMDCEEYQLDEQLTEAIFGEDNRTVTVIGDVGTDNEKVYTQTVGKGSYVIVVPNHEYEEVVYFDPECTEAKENDGDPFADATFYLKRVE